QRRDRSAGELCHHVRHHVGWLHFTSDQNPERYRRIIMSAGYVTAGVDHHHERRSDRQWRDNSRTRADYRAANCQDQEERSDEFGDILVHKSILIRNSLKKARHISNGTLVLSLRQQRTV